MRSHGWSNNTRGTRLTWPNAVAIQGSAQSASASADRLRQTGKCHKYHVHRCTQRILILRSSCRVTCVVSRDAWIDANPDKHWPVHERMCALCRARAKYAVCVSGERGAARLSLCLQRCSGPLSIWSAWTPHVHLDIKPIARWTRGRVWAKQDVAARPRTHAADGGAG